MYIEADPSTEGRERLRGAALRGRTALVVGELGPVPRGEDVRERLVPLLTRRA